MQFEIRNKRIVDFVQSLSFQSFGTAIGLSFLTASVISLVSAFYLTPTQSKSNPSGVRRVALKMPARGLDKAGTKVILERNIFNSSGELGDVDPTAETTKSPIITSELVKSNLPLKLTGIIFSGDPETGLATLQDTRKRRTQSYVVGDTVVNKAKLIGIYESRIILDNEGRREYLELEQFEIVRSRRKKGNKPNRRGISRIATKPPPESHQEDGFERKGSEIKISEEFKRGLLSPKNMTKILQDAKAEPNMVNGELKGFRLTRIREDSVYEKAGFQNNDIVEEINGIPLRDAAGAIRLLNQLKSVKDIEVRVGRGGASFDLNIEIQ
ncbi:MAG: hypothetical protein HRU19_26080 [Pseudobacteriovorax sp.]|nr:hypothetical protein [Pseudobacteriovorax sp.]